MIGSVNPITSEDMSATEDITATVQRSGQSSRSLPQARRKVGSGDKNDFYEILISCSVQLCIFSCIVAFFAHHSVTSKTFQSHSNYAFYVSLLRQIFPFFHTLVFFFSRKL